MRFLLLLIFPFFISATEPLIESKTVKSRSVHFKLNRNFSKKYINKDLHITYPKEVHLKNLPRSVIEIPAIALSITAIWFSGDIYTIDEMDEDFYHSLKKVKIFLERFFPNTPWKGELRPKRLVKNVFPQIKNRPAMFFTAGLDSTATLCRHIDENPVLLSCNKPKKSASKFAKEHNLDFHTIHANYEQFLNCRFLNHASCDIIEWLGDTSQGLTLVGLAAPYLYALGIPKLYIASDFHWLGNIYPDGKPMTRATNPILEENLSPMGITVIHDAFDKTRVDKMKIVSTFCSTRKCAKPELAVCFEHKDKTFFNCCLCEKCYRTILNIMAIGEDPGEYGFHLSCEKFISLFQPFILSFRSPHRGHYTVFSDSQNAIRENLETLPSQYRSFYEWYLTIDLWDIIEEPSRPDPSHPFTWEDYRDLYPELPEMD